MIELNKIYQLDCIEGMKLIPDKSINLIVIDPPYNIGKDKRWDKWKKIDDYITWMGEVFEECQRVLAENGSFYWFHNDMTQIRKLMNVIDQKTKLIFKQFIVWDKYNGSKWNQLNAIVHSETNRNYPKQAEYCLFYTFQDESGLTKVMGDYDNFEAIKSYFRGEKQRIEGDLEIRLKDSVKWTTHFHWFAQGQSWGMCTEERYRELQDTFPGYFMRSYESLRQEYESLRQEYESLRYTFNNQALPSVWLHEPIPQNGHITPKPITIIENIIRTSSNPGDIVLDCFMGSGTTAVAAQTLGRNWIGFEREPKYVELARKRVDAI